jgi:hypothetical protein
MFEHTNADIGCCLLMSSFVFTLVVVVVFGEKKKHVPKKQTNKTQKIQQQQKSMDRSSTNVLVPFEKIFVNLIFCGDTLNHVIYFQ